MEDGRGSLCFLNRKQTNNRDLAGSALFPCAESRARIAKTAISRDSTPTDEREERRGDGVAHVRNYTRLKYPSRWKTIQDEVDPEIYSNSNSVSLV